jgi:NAD+ synthase (glutamine-hydrolysing)
VSASEDGDETVQADVRRVAGYGECEVVSDAQDLAGRLLHTVYMGTVNSSSATQQR